MAVLVGAIDHGEGCLEDAVGGPRRDLVGVDRAGDPGLIADRAPLGDGLALGLVFAVSQSWASA
ncbi:MAG: hypothetical protein ABEH59_04125 [Halobacteriales archaeon]